MSVGAAAVKRKRLASQYSGPLTPQQTATGINAARRNGQRLASDARVLLDMGRSETACALAILAIEEAGKSAILRRLVLERDPEYLRAAWKDYRRHVSKNINWILPDLVVQGARTLDHLQVITDPESQHPVLVEHLKQTALYTDCLEGGKWSEPKEAVGQKLAEKLVITAELLTRGREITVKEIELWVKHMSPAWRESTELMRAAVIAWHQECRSQGLVPLTEDMSAFLGYPTSSKNEGQGT